MAFNIVRNRSLSEGLRIEKCGECGLSGVPFPVGGSGNKGILIVIWRPTEKQLERRSWFASDITALHCLTKAGVNLVDDTWVTAVLPCGDGTKHKKQENYEQCGTRLKDTIEKLKPNLIITVGSKATGAVCRNYSQVAFPPNSSGGQYMGQCIPLTQKWDCWLAPVFSDQMIHAFRKEPVQNMAKDWLKKHIDTALDWLKERPRPDVVFNPNVELLYDTKEIVAALEDAKTFKYAAFDYECNCLSPFTKGAKVLCASVAMGDSEQEHRTVAFPFASEIVKQAWCDFLKSSVKKIAHNLKFEETWSSVYFGTPVNNWFADTCVMARVLDCQPGNSGLKFISFCLWGVKGYDADVDAFIESEGKHGLNRLHEVPVDKLLTYCAFDSRLTFMCTQFYSRAMKLGF